jgi:hypothetical protein
MMTIDKDDRNGDKDDFQIRRPLTRKDYFIFGLSDRMNF